MHLFTVTNNLGDEWGFYKLTNGVTGNVSYVMFNDGEVTCGKTIAELLNKIGVL